jgi:hypothetical protein
VKLPDYKLGLLTNQGGYVHNGSECTLIQTAADETVFGGATIWGDGVATWDKVSYADLQAHLNGSNNTWLKCNNGLYSEAVQYDVGDTFTNSEEIKNENYFGDNCGAGFRIPLEDSLGSLLTDSAASQLYSAG